jgi:surface antigen
MSARSSLLHRLVPACTVAAVIAGLAGTAHAQRLYGAPDDILSPADFTRMHEAASHLYENRKPGSVERWTGPESKDSGSVQLLRTFQTQGMPCSRLRYRIRFAAGHRSAQTYLLNWCKTSGGEWKIEDRTPPAPPNSARANPA